MARAGFIFVLLLFLLPGITAAGELFLCRDVAIHEPIGTGSAKAGLPYHVIVDLKKKACRLFRPGDKIVAVYYFTQMGTEDLIEFRWKRRIGPNTRMNEKSYLHRIEKKSPGDHYLAFAWLDPPPSLFDLALGSRYAGDWVVEVYIDQKQMAEAEFTIRGH